MGSSTIQGEARGGGLDTLAFVCLYITIFTIPAEVLVPLVSGVSAVKLVGVSLVGAASLRLLGVRCIRKLSAIHALLIALVAWIGLSCFWSIDPEFSIVRATTFLQLMFLAWMVWELAPGQDRIKQLIQAFVLGTIPTSASTVYNALIGRTAADLYASAYGSGGPAGTRFAAGEFNANDLGLILAISVPMSAYLLTGNTRIWLRVVCGIQLLLVIPSVLLTGSRGSTIALTPAFVCAGAMFWRWQGPRWMVAMLILALLAGAIVTLPQETWTRLLSSGKEVAQGTLTHRTTLWSLAAETFREAPFTGVGSGAFQQMSSLALGRALVTHNTYLSILAELGIIGALIFISLLSSLLYSALRLPYSEKWLWLGVLAVWMIGVSALTWEYTKTTWLIFGLLAAHEGANQQARELNILQSPASSEREIASLAGLTRRMSPRQRAAHGWRENRMRGV